MARKREVTTLERIRAVELATRHGQEVRLQVRRKAGRSNPVRAQRIENAIAGINREQAALRHDIGRMIWNAALEQTHGERARAASAAAQAERRKLRKMLPR